jgi:hypothetical protein
VRLQDLDFDRKQVVQGKERPLCTTFNSFNPSITKYIKAEKRQDYLFNEPLANGTGVILIIGIPNVACNGGEAGNKAVGIQKKFMYIHTSNVCNHLKMVVLSRSKDQNIGTNPIFMWFY